MKKTFLIFLIIIFVGIVYFCFDILNKNSNSPSIVFSEIENINTKYISGQVWPPEIYISEASDFICEETPKESSVNKRVYKENINGQEYCISAFSEGAAGSVYTEYSYSTFKFNKLITLDFTLRFNQCYNYPEEQQKECTSERESFNPSNLVNEIISNAEFL